MDDLEREFGRLEDVDDDDSSDDDSLKSSKRAKLPLIDPLCGKTPKESGFYQSSRVCLEQIRDALLHHRWQEAAEYMACYPQMLQDSDKGTGMQAHKELIWRISAEILHHHPNSKLDDYNSIYERMKHSGLRHYLMIALEHSFHLLLNGHIEDARRQLSVAESWRYGKESAAQHQRTKLIHAYRSLLDYIIWCDKKFTHCNTLEDHDDNQDMHNYFRQASVNLKEIVKNPGIWDPFILSYVEMLEFYGDQEEALKVLSDYAYDSNFPPNPNAYVYLYEYLKRHDTPERKLMKVLKILHVLVPSHELMLEYSSLLLQSEKTNGAQKALGVVLALLDFSCWRSNLDVWQRLKAVIQKLQLQEDWKDVVFEKMAERKDWWPALHFTSFQASKDSEENPELMEVKESLTKILCPDLELKYTVQLETSGAQSRTRTQR